MLEIVAGEPILMGIVNANSDSFSDGGLFPSTSAQLERACELVDAGAEIIDVGGESASPLTPRQPEAIEIELVTSLISELSRTRSCFISIDTYKPAVAEAAVAAGAHIVNDISCLRDPGIAEVCVRTNAALIIMHNRGVPKQRLLASDLYDDVASEVAGDLEGALERARSAGVRWEQIILDPGLDFSKTPAQTVELLRGLDHVLKLGRPVLLAISRKDFIGALTGRAATDRLAGTLAALDYGVRTGAHIFRVHDVAESAAYVRSLRALSDQA